MFLMTYNEILTKLCDDFDSLISPKKITRANTNIFYLLLKAISKGFELINNICVVLNNKFNPATCSVEDLDSVSALVGTNRLEGSATGLYIMVLNDSAEAVPLAQGTYWYKLDEDVSFYFDVLSDTNLASGEDVEFIAMSDKIGEYPVTAQDSITVTSVHSIPAGLVFSCADNSSLLGAPRETDLAFRKRILQGINNQDSITELENTLRNLPYIFDCKCFYNQYTTDATYDGITIPPFSLAIFYVGMARNEIAEIVASRIICPTVSTEDSVELSYHNNAFVSGSFAVNIIPFKKTSFSIDIKADIDLQYTSIKDIRAKLTPVFNRAFSVGVHRDYIKEEDIYNILNSVEIQGFNVLGVNIIYNGQAVDYIQLLQSRVPEFLGMNIIPE